MRKSLTQIIAVGALPLMLGLKAQAATVDLLVLYDSHSANYFNQQVEAAMQNWVAQINNAYRDSNVDIQLRLAGAVPHEQAGADMNAVLTSLRTNTTAVNLRAQYGADFVTQLHQTGECGIGYFAVSSGWAWNVVGPDCGPLTMAHELGHNMGLAHSRKQGDTTGSRYAYGLGHGVDGLFGTIMTYSWLYTNRASGRVAKFSNPDVSCLGAPCGVPAGQPDQANAALALNNVKNEIAAFRSAVAQSSSSRSSVASSTVSSTVVSVPASSSARSQVVISSSSRVAVSSAISSVRSSVPASSSSRSSVVATSSRANSSAAVVAQARCEYQVLNQSSRNFTARINITNTGSQVINGWSVNWQYQPNTWLTYASGAGVSGRNPYTAVHNSSNLQINPGQRTSFTVYGVKPRWTTAETPRVTGAICR
ncbi:MAG TPA: cellulose binding domain-containing protein [Cellvibrio sp.]|nr:cellulose binding domain-containing protein [Cellvibrio sp.]